MSDQPDKLILEEIDRVRQSIAEVADSYAARGRDLLQRMEAIQQDMTALRSEIAEARNEMAGLRAKIRRRPDPVPDLDAAVQRYVARFGVGPPVWEFLEHKAELIREMVAAVECGEPLAAPDLYRRFGMTPPGVIL